MSERKTYLLCILLSWLLLSCGGSKTDESSHSVPNTQPDSGHADGHAQDADNPSSSTHDKTAGAQQHDAPHFAYQGLQGPEHWGDLAAAWATCKTGEQQSPINIHQVSIGQASVLDCLYEPMPLNLVNNGHTIQQNNTVRGTLRHGDDRYELLQFHFHAPSEHTIDGKHADMEMHLVHKNEAGQLAVIGVLMRRGEENPMITRLWANMPKETGGVVQVAQATIDLGAALPKNRAHYIYSGSLTTPPCSEGVRWFVLQEGLEVSEAQINQFLMTIDSNARPTQPLEGRVVAKSGG